DPAVQIGDVNVFPPVIVVIADGCAKAPAAMVQAGLGSYVGESAVMIITIEFARMTFAGAQVFESRAIHQQNIHPAVVVVVEHGDAATHGFHDVALFQAAAGQVKVNSC